MKKFLPFKATTIILARTAFGKGSNNFPIHKITTIMINELKMINSNLFFKIR
jgi:hypothetical protein